MGAWGVKALQSDEGLDVLALIEELAEGRASLTADELVDAVQEEGLLGDDPSEDEYMFDVAALALAEILTGDVEQREDALFRETTFPVTPRGAAVLID